MRKIFGWSLIVVAAMLGALAPKHALAQGNTTGLVVTTCGTVPAAFIAGNPGPFTVNTSGQLCNTGGGGGGGDATAANQALQITQETAINTILGTVAVSPTANTISDRLKVLNTTLGTPFQAGGSIGNAFALDATLSTMSGKLPATLTTAGADGVSNTLSGLQAYSRCQLFNGTTWDRCMGDTTGGLWVNVKPSTDSSSAIAPSTAVAAAESCRVLKASAGNLYSLLVSIAATSGYVMIFNATSAPADGAVAPALPAVRLVSDGTSAWAAFQFNPPEYLATGITVCFSSTGPFTKTASATAAIGGQVK